jgi:hypothetical protein
MDSPDDIWLRRIFGRNRMPTARRPFFVPGQWPNTLKCCKDGKKVRNLAEAVINGNSIDYLNSYQNKRELKGLRAMPSPSHSAPLDWDNSVELTLWDDTTLYAHLDLSTQTGLALGSPTAACPICGAKVGSNPNPDEERPETRTTFKGAVWYRFK